MNKLYKSLASNVFFAVHERLKGLDTVQILKEMEETQWWPVEKIDELRVKRLRLLLNHAVRHVPYYNDVLRSASISPESIDSLNALESIPFLTKADIRSNLGRLKSGRSTDLSRSNTGGRVWRPSPWPPWPGAATGRPGPG